MYIRSVQRISSSNLELSGTTVHVLKYKRGKERYIILLQHELGDAAR